MIVVDTNVLSELVKERPAEAVLDWMDAQPAGLLTTTATNVTELLYGVARLPVGRRRRMLADIVQEMLEQDFCDRVIPFDLASAAEFAEVVACRDKAGRPIGLADAQIAAVCRSRDAHLATRNTTDFDGTGVVVINPWDR